MAFHFAVRVNKPLLEESPCSVWQWIVVAAHEVERVVLLNGETRASARLAIGLVLQIRMPPETKGVGRPVQQRIT